MMGGMMGSGGGAWILLSILLGLAIAVTAGVVVARALGQGRKADQPQVGTAEPPAVHAAKDALRMRYAQGEISREDYLQGKVELED
jgi:putative membrane protein